MSVIRKPGMAFREIGFGSFLHGANGLTNAEVHPSSWSSARRTKGLLDNISSQQVSRLGSPDAMLALLNNVKNMHPAPGTEYVFVDMERFCD